MVRQKPWDKHEAVILLDAVIHVSQEEIDRKQAILDVSNKLRSMAIKRGFEIDEIYRNVAGITFQMCSMESAMTMQQVVRDINEDYLNRIESIKANNPYDDLEMSGSRAVWPQLLSIYAVKTTTDPDNAMEVATMAE